MISGLGLGHALGHGTAFFFFFLVSIMAFGVSFCVWAIDVACKSGCSDVHIDLQSRNSAV